MMTINASRVLAWVAAIVAGMLCAISLPGLMLLIPIVIWFIAVDAPLLCAQWRLERLERYFRKELRKLTHE